MTEIFDQILSGTKKAKDWDENELAVYDLTTHTTLFLVIKHANAPTQVKYLPMLREAVKNGNVKAHNLALLEDRVMLAFYRYQMLQ